MTAERITVRTSEAAKILGISEIWLKKDRCKETPIGPPAIRKGRMILYKLTDLNTWLDDDRSHSC